MLLGDQETSATVSNERDAYKFKRQLSESTIRQSVSSTLLSFGRWIRHSSIEGEEGNPITLHEGGMDGDGGRLLCLRGCVADGGVAAARNGSILYRCRESGERS